MGSCPYFNTYQLYHLGQVPSCLLQTENNGLPPTFWEAKIQVDIKALRKYSPK